MVMIIFIHFFRYGTKSDILLLAPLVQYYGLVSYIADESGFFSQWMPHTLSVQLSIPITNILLFFGNIARDTTFPL